MVAAVAAEAVADLVVAAHSVAEEEATTAVTMATATVATAIGAGDTIVASATRFKSLPT
jgi:hypothetical protein